MPAKGDGIFMWYWGPGAEPEQWSKGFASLKAAAEHAYGHQPHGDYTLMEADRVTISPKVFSAARILRDLEAANVIAWPGDFPSATERELADLEAKLADCLDRWLRKHNFDSTTAIHSIRTREYHPDRRGSAHG